MNLESERLAAIERRNNELLSYFIHVRTEARTTQKIKRELRRRSAVEPVIGHLKSENRMGRNNLWHSQGDAINAVLAAVGYNFRRLIRWLRLLLCLIIARMIGLGCPLYSAIFGIRIREGSIK